MHKLVFAQKIPFSLELCWDFFSSPNNLAILTPPSLGFSAKHDVKKPMYAGQIFMHSITPFPLIRLAWITEITHVAKYEYFIDEQRLGPYKFWHHEHRFVEIKKGIEVNDIVHYQLPFGWLGQVINALKIRKDLEAIFIYRKLRLEQLFGAYVNS